MVSIFITYDIFLLNSIDDRPNAARLPLSWVRYRVTTDLTLRYSRFLGLDKEERRCTSDPEYNFNKCVETTYSKR